MLLASNANWAYNMIISGFVLGVVIFALFLWQSVNNYITVRQIDKFKTKTKNIYRDKYAWWVIRSIELVICLLMITEIALFIAAEILKAKHTNLGNGIMIPDGTYSYKGIDNYTGGHNANWYNAEQLKGLQDALAKNAIIGSLNNFIHKGNIAVNVAAAHNIIFLVMAVFVISYMAIAYLWNASIVVVVNQDNLITSSNVAPRNKVTVSRVLKFPHMFKITYRDPDLKGNLKEVRIRYSKKMDAFLSRNGFYDGDKDD